MKTNFVNGIHGDVCPKHILDMINQLSPMQSLEKDILIKEIVAHINAASEDLNGKIAAEFENTYKEEISRLEKLVQSERDNADSHYLLSQKRKEALQQILTIVEANI